MSTLETISALAIYHPHYADTAYATVQQYAQNGVVAPAVLKALVAHMAQNEFPLLQAEVATIFPAAYGNKMGKSSVIKPAAQGVSSVLQANLGTQIFHNPETDEIGLTIGADRHCRPTTILVFRHNDKDEIEAGSVFYHSIDGKTQMFDCHASPNSRLVNIDMLAVHARDGKEWTHVAGHHAVVEKNRCKEKDLDKTNIATIRAAELLR